MAATHLDDVFDELHGLPHPRWDAVADAIDRLPQHEQDAAWTEIIRRWLLDLAEVLHSESQVVCCEDLFCLASHPQDQAQRLAPWAVNSLQQIIAIVGEHRTSEMCGPRVIIILADHERYYDYIDRYYEDPGEYGGSGGVCIHGGYVHVVCGPGEYDTRRLILAHELTHLALAPLELPAWLNEGMAQIMEERIIGMQTFGMSHELRQRHLDYWHETTLQPFWSGEAFGQPDEAEELSYHLAEILTRNIVAEHAGRLSDLLAKSHWRDAGDSAAKEVLGYDLCALASQFLGPGDWAPRAIDDAPGILLTNADLMPESG